MDKFILVKNLEALPSFMAPLELDKGDSHLYKKIISTFSSLEEASIAQLNHSINGIKTEIYPIDRQTRRMLSLWGSVAYGWDIFDGKVELLRDRFETLSQFLDFYLKELGEDLFWKWIKEYLHNGTSSETMGWINTLEEEKRGDLLSFLLILNGTSRQEWGSTEL
tara:strand:- start:8079 stop:8573 length:495 start_codon:yes stop_codon:yes gene_type:complete